jgi:DNA-binding NarL/FixJ family response regulator
VLVVDDYSLFRKGVVQLLNDEADIEVCAQAGSVGEVLDAIRRHLLDLALVDMSLDGGTNGIESTKAIRAERPPLPVLILSTGRKPRSETCTEGHYARPPVQRRWHDVQSIRHGEYRGHD